MEIVDIPHIICRNLQNPIIEEKNNFVSVVYAGVIRENLIRNVLDVFLPFLADGNLKIFFYGRSTVSSIERYCDEKSLRNISFGGMVSHDKIIEIESSANVLMSLGNSNMDFIPSKIFEYMSFGGKILHFYNYEKDSCLPYLRKYPNSCCVDVRDNRVQNIKKIEEFINSDMKRISFDSLKKIFYMNTPSYTVEKIVSVFENAAGEEIR